MKPRDPNRSDYARVIGSVGADGVIPSAGAEDADEAAEITLPTCAVPIDGAN